jgi:enediyne core biosynthesis thioesterase
LSYYELRHVVSFEETNLLGNVYFVNHFKWQGRCREMFLRERAPGVLGEIAQGLRLATVRCSCEYLEELAAFDEVAVRMSLAALGPSSLTLRFDYVRLDNGTEVAVARGEQAIACLRGNGGAATAAPVPAELREALRPYAGSAV